MLEKKKQAHRNSQQTPSQHFPTPRSWSLPVEALLPKDSISPCHGVNEFHVELMTSFRGSFWAGQPIFDERQTFFRCLDLGKYCYISIYDRWQKFLAIQSFRGFAVNMSSSSTIQFLKESFSQMKPPTRPFFRGPWRNINWDQVFENRCPKTWRLPVFLWK